MGMEKGKFLSLTRFQTPNPPARSESLYMLRCAGPLISSFLFDVLIGLSYLFLVYTSRHN
jgi:hypothetical protein